jgi:hypothetical protein
MNNRSRDIDFSISVNNVHIDNKEFCVCDLTLEQIAKLFVSNFLNKINENWIKYAENESRVNEKIKKIINAADFANINFVLNEKNENEYQHTIILTNGVEYGDFEVNISTKEKWKEHKIKMLLIYLALRDNHFITPKNYGLELYYKKRNELIELHKRYKNKIKI